jgi:DNA repair exonuclease SbcCD ATPase subunit
MTIMARIAAMKAEMLKREAGLREKLAQKKAEGQELRVSLSAAKEDLAQKEATFHKTKKTVLAANKSRLSKQRKMDAEGIAEAKARVAKLRADYHTKQAWLSTKVEKAKTEVALFTTQLKEQRKKYASLQAEFASEKAALQKHHEAVIAEEKTKTMATEAEMKATLENCALKTKTLRAAVNQLKVELKSKISHIVIIKDQSAKRKALADVMTSTESQLHGIESKITAEELLHAQTCAAGTPGAWLRARCEKLRHNTEALKSEAHSFESKLKQYREKYSTI